MCLLFTHVEQAQVLLTRVEIECAKVGLKQNANKKEVITYNILPNHSALTTTGGTALKEVNVFKHLGAWMRRRTLK